jgi:hypothetical protein
MFPAWIYHLISSCEVFNQNVVLNYSFCMYNWLFPSTSSLFIHSSNIIWRIWITTPSLLIFFIPLFSFSRYFHWRSFLTPSLPVLLQWETKFHLDIRPQWNTKVEQDTGIWNSACVSVWMIWFLGEV